ncbi:hypothetical protein CCMA1212_010134 [Trichoderma ghanense]|uniref:Uncharacterized protein n=1 Tax=Trichoderma ghanense TaxID=65468 RepID=A0ABY2GRQ0_9HYPO
MAKALFLRHSALQLASTHAYHRIYAARRFLASTSIVLKDARRSREKAESKSHKGETCGKSQPSTATPGASTSKIKPASSRPGHDMPFTRLYQGIWLHDRPEAETYELLIDTYRLRVEDTYVFRGELMEDSLYATRSSGLRGFRKFLEKAAAVPGLLPAWWNEEKKAACEKLGMTRSQWSDLHCAVEKSDIIDHYKDPVFPMKLRMLGVTVYGLHPSGTDGTVMRKLMMTREQGGPGASSGNGFTYLIDWSGMKMCASNSIVLATRRLVCC